MPVSQIYVAASLLQTTVVFTHAVYRAAVQRFVLLLICFPNVLVVDTSINAVVSKDCSGTAFRTVNDH